MKTAYLWGFLDADGRVEAVAICSDTPERSTRAFRHGKVAREIVTLTLGQGDTHEEAVANMRETYAALFPVTSLRLPALDR